MSNFKTVLFLGLVVVVVLGGKFLMQHDKIVEFDVPAEFKLEKLDSDTTLVHYVGADKNLVAFSGRIIVYRNPTAEKIAEIYTPRAENETLFGKTKNGEGIKLFFGGDVGGRSWRYVTTLHKANDISAVVEMIMSTDESPEETDFFRNSEAARSSQRAELVRIFENMVRSLS